MSSILEGGRLGRYHIQEQLGRGGMATVFKARDPSLNRTVAIKVLAFLRADEPAFRERFGREAQAIARLNHPNILQVFDVGEDKGFTYIVTEYVSGGTLLDRLGSPYNLEDTLRILRPLAEALDYAHASGIVHRDIKPSNVLMNDDAEPVLADFGLSVAMEQMYHVTAPQEAIGTPEYMSPEQAMGRDVDHRSDLYALGILCYQLLVGVVPFHANTAAATMMAHVHQPLPLSEGDDVDLQPGVKATLLKALAKNPDERYQSAMGLVEALAASLPSVQSAVMEPDSPTGALPKAVLPPDPSTPPQRGRATTGHGLTSAPSRAGRLTRCRRRADNHHAKLKATASETASPRASIRRWRNVIRRTCFNLGRNARTPARIVRSSVLTWTTVVSFVGWGRPGPTRGRAAPCARAWKRPTPGSLGRSMRSGATPDT